jgi:hypothetical protein
MTTLVQTNYTATQDDFYLGVEASSPITITLPECEDGKQYIIKSEMKPPISNRRIRIVAADGSKFDGYSEHTISVSHDCLWVIRHSSNWHIIK